MRWTDFKRVCEEIAASGDADRHDLELQRRELLAEWQAIAAQLDLELAAAPDSEQRTLLLERAADALRECQRFALPAMADYDLVTVDSRLDDGRWLVRVACVAAPGVTLHGEATDESNDRARERAQQEVHRRLVRFQRSR